MKHLFFRSFLSGIACIAALAACVLDWSSADKDLPPEFKGAADYDVSSMKTEKIGRGIIAVRQDAENVFVTWRYLTSDPLNTAFNVYRDGKKLNDKPIADVTYYVDKNPGGGSYSVRPVVRGWTVKEKNTPFILADNAPVGYLDIPLDKPADGVTRSGERYTYSPNDCSVGDVDGDGEFEIFLKWDPSNSHDNSQDGYTGNVLIDCYKLDGTKLWRIDLGGNIRAGAHYTQFLVYDFDGDGKAEMICKTADGTTDGAGKVIGKAKADHVETGEEQENDFSGIDRKHALGRILSGPEYLTVFDGATGRALETVNYYPPRGDVLDWGDNYGNRCDRFLACIGCLDGEHISPVMCRGYYDRMVIVAYTWDGKRLQELWTFDSEEPEYADDYTGQGNHNLYCGDVDHDGRDEIVYGSAVIDHDGTGLYACGFFHGDAMDLAHFAPDMPDLSVLSCHEKDSGITLRNAKTGELAFPRKRGGVVGRCLCADIDPTNYGLELWAPSGIGLLNRKGEVLHGISGRNATTGALEGPSNLSCNFAVWWDGDLLRELFDKAEVTKFDWTSGRCDSIARFTGALANNDTKSTPCLSGDLFGDWREEILLRSDDNEHLRLYVSTSPTGYRFHSFIQDQMYRNCIALQNVCYNQPPHPGFYFGPDLVPADGSRILFRGTILQKNPEQ